MAEYLRSVCVKVVIDTNKATYEETFDNLPDALNFYASHTEEFTPEQSEQLRQLAARAKAVLGN